VAVDSRPVEVAAPKTAVPVGMALRNHGGLSGVSRYVTVLARRLPAEGFEAVVLARDWPDGAPGPRVPWFSLNSWTRAASFDWLARRGLKARGVRLVHGHGDLSRQDVLSLHNCDAAAARFVPGAKISAGTAFMRRRQLGPDGARVLIVYSERVRRDAAEFYGVPEARLRRVYFGVDQERFHPGRRDAARAALLKAAGWPAETRIVLAVLSGDPVKRNFSLTARAVDILSKKSPAALCLVGKAVWETDPAARALRNVGRLYHAPATPAVEDFYAAADALALPAHYEEFGLPALEALASGCPPVVGERCGAAELLTEGRDGEIVRSLDDPEELAAKLADVMDAPARREAARRAAAPHTWERHAAAVARIYRELL